MKNQNKSRIKEDIFLKKRQKKYNWERIRKTEEKIIKGKEGGGVCLELITGYKFVFKFVQ